MELLFIDFLNSDWHDYRVKGLREDRLEQPEWLKDFLERWHLEGPSSHDPDIVPALVAFRTLLHRMVATLYKEEELAKADLVALNKYLKSTLVQQELEKSGEAYQVRLVPVERDWNWVMTEIAASFAKILTVSDAKRLRICENPDCGWVFYDASKNRSHRWCERATCANLMKVRRFRARQREKTQPD